MSNSKDFEVNINDLRKIVNDLEFGELNLSDSLKNFEEGIHLYSSCLKIIENAEEKISILTEDLESGDFKKIAFDPEEI